jgi:malate dehydrogenase
VTTFSYVLSTDRSCTEAYWAQNVNAGICATLAEAIAKACPNAYILVISNPVNSTVPVFAEVLKKAGCFDPKK